jgi:ribosome recycling factor
MAIKELIDDARSRMDASLETVRRELASMRTGRASLAILDGVRVDYYGTPTPLNQLANLHVADPTLITVQPWDPSVLVAVEKAIRTSELDLNPQNDG